MADFHARIIPLKTEEPGRVPNDATMQGLGLDPIHVGELAVNLQDGLIYSKKSDGEIVTLGGSSGGGGGGLGSGDPLWPQVDQLVTFDGLEDGSEIIPEKGRDPSGNWATTIGARAIKTVASGGLSKWGSSSMFSNGGGNTMWGSIGTELGTDDWTWEVWFYIDISQSHQSTGTYQNLIWGIGDQFNDQGYTHVSVYRHTGDSRACYFNIRRTGVNVDTYLTGDVLVDLSWNYVAVTRQQGWLRFYINGIRQYEIDLTAEALNFNYPSWRYGTYLWGYYNDFRFTRGVARYTGDNHDLPQRAHPPSTITPIYLDDLVDVTVTGTATERTLKIDYLDWIQFSSDNVPEGERWGVYANTSWGFVSGRYDASTSDADRSQARTFYTPSKGIIHSTDTGHHWLAGDFGDPRSNVAPELRWMPRPSLSSNTWFGIKLNDSWPTSGTASEMQFTMTLPPAVPTAPLSFMAVKPTGETTWQPVELDPKELLILNFDSTTEDIPELGSGNMTTQFPSLDAKFGDGGATFVRANQDYLTGSWSEPLGLTIWTFEFWFKTSDNDASSGIGKRIISPQVDTNIEGGFQIYFDPTAAAGQNEAFALELNPTGNEDGFCVSTNAFVTNDGEWHHYVFQHEGGGTYACFADGVLQQRLTRPLGAVDFQIHGGFFIGTREQKEANSFLSGSLDAMRLTKNALVYGAADTIEVPTVPPAPPGVLQLYLDDLTDVDTTTEPPSAGEVLTWNEATSIWEPQPVVGASGTGPVIKAAATGALLPGAYELLTLTDVGRAGLLRELVNSSGSTAWVVIYCSEAARAADIASGRTELEDPAVGAGVLAEFVLTAATTRVVCTPPPVTFNAQAETVPELYLRVVNNGNESAAITLQLHLSRTEP